MWHGGVCGSLRLGLPLISVWTFLGRWAWLCFGGRAVSGSWKHVFGIFHGFEFGLLRRMNSTGTFLTCKMKAICQDFVEDLDDSIRSNPSHRLGHFQLTLFFGEIGTKS